MAKKRKRDPNAIDSSFRTYFQFHKKLASDANHEADVLRRFNQEKDKKKADALYRIIRGVWSFNKRRESIIQAIRSHCVETEADVEEILSHLEKGVVETERSQTGHFFIKMGRRTKEYVVGDDMWDVLGCYYMIFHYADYLLTAFDQKTPTMKEEYLRFCVAESTLGAQIQK